MSEEPSKSSAPELPPELQPQHQEEIAALFAAAGVATGAAGDKPSGRGSLKRKLIVASLIAAIGLGASIMSCVGQSFSYRQAHALEGIEQQLKEIRASCVPPGPAKP
jgi:uncharacterized protein HemX